MLEFISIVCIAATLLQGSCLPDGLSAQGEMNAQDEKKVSVSDSYELMIAPGAYQLSYSASGDKFDATALTAYWNQRAAQLCAGEFIGYPITQTQYPQSAYDATFLSGSRNFNVEAYGVAHCVERNG